MQGISPQTIPSPTNGDEFMTMDSEIEELKKMLKITQQELRACQLELMQKRSEFDSQRQYYETILNDQRQHYETQLAKQRQYYDDWIQKLKATISYSPSQSFSFSFTQ
jgi:chromosome segregation ATPase